jgi:hypothetical protein
MKRRADRINAAAEDGRGSRTRRGRPPKFGRPSQVIALTLPNDVIDALRGVHRDLGWAVVRLVESTRAGRVAARQAPAAAAPLAELVHLPGKRALIVVQPQVFKRLQGISTIPLVDGRAFLALDHGNGFADLELAILDKLEASRGSSRLREQLSELRDVIRAWRRDRGLAFRAKSIIVVETGARVERPILRALHDIRSGGRARGRQVGSARRLRRDSASASLPLATE